jgi:hypothetical protein
MRRNPACLRFEKLLSAIAQQELEEPEYSYAKAIDFQKINSEFDS